MGILIILGVVFVLILAHQLDESGYREKCINDKARFEAMQKDKIHIKKIGKNKNSEKQMTNTKQINSKKNYSIMIWILNMIASVNLRRVSLGISANIYSF